MTPTAVAHGKAAERKAEVVVDIETFRKMDERMEELLAGKIKLGNVKDPDKIKKKISEKRDKIYSEAALHPTTARVVSVGLGISEVEGEWDFHCFVDMVDDERALLTVVDEVLADIQIERYITFNGFRFDMQFLAVRAAVHKMQLRRPWPLGRYNKMHTDVYDVLGWNKGSLGQLALAVLGRGTVHTGADVNAMVTNEEWSGVREHQLEDIQLLAEVWDALKTTCKPRR